MTHTDKDKVEGSFNIKTSKNNVIPTFFYSNISEFPEIFQVILNERTYKTTINNIHKLGLRA